jgi:hypothetical protein
MLSIVFALFVLFFIIFLIVLVQRYADAICMTTSIVFSPPYPSSLTPKIMEKGLGPALNEAVRESDDGYVIVKLPGNDEPSVVTRHLSEFPPDQFHKKGSIPTAIMDIARLTTKGTSVFIENLSDRGPENQRKVQYMSALTRPHLEQHRTTIRNVLRDPCPSSTLLDRVIEITWRLHFGKPPCPQAIEFFHSFRAAFSDRSLYGIWTSRQHFILQKPHYVEFLCREVQAATVESIAGVWMSTLLSRQFTVEDMVVEISHNMLAMPMQWFLLSREALKNPVLASSDPSTFFNSNAFAPSIVSLDNHHQRVIAQIEPTVSNPKKCPYQSSRSCPLYRRTTRFNQDLEELPHGEIVPCGEAINVAPEFLAFGKGYRRCAGEVLTHIYLEELLHSPVQFADPDLGNIPWAFTRAR